MIFVKYNQYSPQIMEKSDSNQPSLATTSILGQPPRQRYFILAYHLGEGPTHGHHHLERLSRLLRKIVLNLKAGNGLQALMRVLQNYIFHV